MKRCYFWKRFIGETIPSVSVIIPVYDVELYLKECLESVRNQTLRQIEIICINDGSKDSSLKILSEYAAGDKRISIYNQENEGLSSARNVGLKKVAGKYIYFMDSDDVLDRNALYMLFKKLNRRVWKFCILRENVFRMRINIRIIDYVGVSLESGLKMFWDLTCS